MTEKRYVALAAVKPAKLGMVVHLAAIDSGQSLCGKPRTGWQKTALRREHLCLRCHAAYRKQHKGHGGTGLPGEALGGE